MKKIVLKHRAERNDREVDFVTRKGKTVTSLILITWDRDEMLEYKGKRIEVCSANEWFISR